MMQIPLRFKIFAGGEVALTQLPSRQIYIRVKLLRQNKTLICFALR